MGRHAAHVVRRGRRRAIRRADTRVVLRATPRQADARVSNWITLHLVDRHLCSMSVNELDEATALSRGDLDVGDFAKALEERAELIFSDITREAANENSRIVGVGELVHRLHHRALAIVGDGRPHGAGMTRDRRHHVVGSVTMPVLVRTVTC